MSAPDIPTVISNSEEIVVRTRRLKRLLHSPDFVAKKISKVKTVFGESEEPSLALVLNQLSVLLREDPEMKQILREECGDLVQQPYYPHFLLYCSTVVYFEYIKISQGSSTR